MAFCNPQKWKRDEAVKFKKLPSLFHTVHQVERGNNGLTSDEEDEATTLKAGAVTPMLCVSYSFLLPLHHHRPQFQSPPMNPPEMNLYSLTRKTLASYSAASSPWNLNTSSLALPLPPLVPVTVWDELINQNRNFGLKTASEELDDMSMVDLGENDDLVDELLYFGFLDSDRSTIYKHSLVHSALTTLSKYPAFAEIPPARAKMPKPAPTPENNTKRQSSRNDNVQPYSRKRRFQYNPRPSVFHQNRVGTH
ncbi:unnamed protein product [Thlaspi arvense]|uniref:Uncharacterized protein n=1 Tax=Thlaspi arvense TaxID=13288 RepID=A0AAU9RDX7_THLAR|nr:unnamed protein product [Thlaspi arvense]